MRSELVNTVEDKKEGKLERLLSRKNHKKDELLSQEFTALLDNITQMLKELSNIENTNAVKNSEKVEGSLAKGYKASQNEKNKEQTPNKKEPSIKNFNNPDKLNANKQKDVKEQNSATKDASYTHSKIKSVKANQEIKDRQEILKPLNSVQKSEDKTTNVQKESKLQNIKLSTNQEIKTDDKITIQFYNALKEEMKDTLAKENNTISRKISPSALHQPTVQSVNIQQSLLSASKNTVEPGKIEGSLSSTGLNLKGKKWKEAQKTNKPSAKSNQELVLKKIQKVMEEISRSKDGKRITVRVNRPQFGKVKIDLTVKKDTLYARLFGDHEKLNLLLREKASEIHQLLRQLTGDSVKIKVLVKEGEDFFFEKEFNAFSNQGRNKEDQNGNSFKENLYSTFNYGKETAKELMNMSAGKAQATGWIA